MSSIPCTIGIMCVLYRGHCPFDVQILHYKYITARKYVQIAAPTFDSHDTSDLPLIRPWFSLVTNCFAIYSTWQKKLSSTGAGTDTGAIDNT